MLYKELKLRALEIQETAGISPWLLNRCKTSCQQMPSFGSQYLIPSGYPQEFLSTGKELRGFTGPKSQQATVWSLRTSQQNNNTSFTCMEVKLPGR